MMFKYYIKIFKRKKLHDCSLDKYLLYEKIFTEFVDKNFKTISEMKMQPLFIEDEECTVT